jgi:hypothetical protein
MKKRMLLGLLLLVAPLAALSPSDIILVHLADGLQWTTTFNIVNLDTTEASYTLYFYADTGAPLSLSFAVDGGAVQTGTSYNGVLAVNGSAVIKTSGGGPALNPGWAHLTSIQKIGAQAVFVEHSIADYEAAVPTGQYFNAFRLPFDNTNGYFTGVAIINGDQVNSVTVNATFRDQTGAAIGTGTSVQAAVIKPYGHTAVLLNLSFPFTAGQIGTVDFTCSVHCQISGLGLQFAPSNGPYTSTSTYGLY